MHKAFFILAKAQILRETRSAFRSLRDAPTDGDYVNYLEGQEADRVLALHSEKQLDEYLTNSRRISLQEWLDSLTWEHIQGRDRHD